MFHVTSESLGYESGKLGDWISPNMSVSSMASATQSSKAQMDQVRGYLENTHGEMK